MTIKMSGKQPSLKNLAHEIYAESGQFSTPQERYVFRKMRLEEYTGPDRYMLKTYLENIAKVYKDRGFCCG